mmetsp:Transcript_23551/g.74115  ORF Transcript_23551/g.74115 Transcript_23551/m.74115 type:complete len:133 (+) Transcript_23551:1213-1611(+)
MAGSLPARAATPAGAPSAVAGSELEDGEHEVLSRGGKGRATEGMEAVLARRPSRAEHARRGDAHRQRAAASVTTAATEPKRQASPKCTGCLGVPSLAASSGGPTAAARNGSRAAAWRRPATVADGSSLHVGG